MAYAKCVSFIIIYIFLNKASATEVTATDWESRFAALEQLVLAQDVRISELEKEIVTLKEGCPNLPNDKTQTNDFKAHTDHPLKGLRLTQTSEVNDKAQKRARSILKLGDEAIPVFPRLLTGDDPLVAFEATIAEEGRIVTLNHDSTIIFDTTSLNIGGAYHAKHGLFVAPRAGIYLFSTSVDLFPANALMHVDIEKNGVEIAGGIATNHDGLHHQASVTALLNLIAGDEVYVNVERRDGMTIYGDKLTSFMGVLLYAL